MKITKNELNNLIKEEVVRQKVIINLKSRKSSILKEMEELGYEAQGQKIETYLPVFEGFFQD
jgi:phosphatidylserine decarboxylase